MKLTENKNGVLQLKEGRKIIFEISTRKGKFSSFRNGLGICTGKNSLSECIIDTFDKIDYLNNDFKTRLISL